MTCGCVPALRRCRRGPAAPGREPDHQGWMRKKGGMSRYRPRFFQLHGGLLYYFAEDADAEPPLGLIDLCGVTLTTNTDGDHGLYLVGNFQSRDYALLAPSSAEKVEWKEKLLRAAAQHTRSEHVRERALACRSKVPKALADRVGTAICTGCLDKRGRRSGRWVRRWFELRGGLLFHAQELHRDSLIRARDLRLATVSCVDEQSRYCFVVSGPHLPGKLVLAACSDDERGRWVAALTEASAQESAPVSPLESSDSDAESEAAAEAAPAQRESPLLGTCTIVGASGAIVRDNQHVTDEPCCTLPKGTEVHVAEVRGNRARITSPLCGWISAVSSTGVVILEAGEVRLRSPGPGDPSDLLDEVLAILRQGPGSDSKSTEGRLRKLDFAAGRLHDATAGLLWGRQDEAEAALADAASASRLWQGQLIVEQYRAASTDGLPRGLDAALRQMASITAAVRRLNTRSCADTERRETVQRLRSVMDRTEDWLRKFKVDCEEYEGAAAVVDEVEDGMDDARRAIDGDQDDCVSSHLTSFAGQQSHRTAEPVPTELAPTERHGGSFHAPPPLHACSPVAPRTPILPVVHSPDTADIGRAPLPPRAAAAAPELARESPAPRFMSSLSDSLAPKPTFNEGRRLCMSDSDVDDASHASQDGLNPPLPLTDGTTRDVRSPPCERPRSHSLPRRCTTEPAPRSLVLGSMSSRADRCRERLMKCVNSRKGVDKALDREVTELREWAEAARDVEKTSRCLKLEGVLANIDAASKLHMSIGRAAVSPCRVITSPVQFYRGLTSPAVRRSRSESLGGDRRGFFAGIRERVL
eukprot:TRINITY_DN12235_c0_g2_i2.p1 TRINITY_DN12235_c0_g2~~TRINITY_DN12235_c0_g2_i2.p1  ORF type:complete len:813 (+),score=241.01 TRINITY_DN12235_c0_g2_i2:54-2492(+)